MAMRALTLFVLLISVTMRPIWAQPCVGQGNAVLGFSPPVLSSSFTATLTGTPLSPIFWYADVAPGSIVLPGIGTVCLGLTPSLLLVLDTPSSGLSLPASGTLALSLVAPADPGLLGQVVFSQFAAADLLAPNGISLSRPASLQFTFPDWYLPTLGPLSTWRGLHSATPLTNGRFVFISGGGNGTLLSPTPVATTDLYDHYTRSFTPGPAMASPRVLHTSTRLADGRILITGGADGISNFNFSDGEIYDPVANTLSPIANSMSVPRAAHTATLLNDGRVLLCGGNQIFAVTGAGNYIQVFQSGNDTTDFFDPTTNLFTPGPMMQIGAGAAIRRMGHEALILPDGRVLLVGGINGATNLIITSIPTYTNQAMIFNPATNTFTSGGTTNTGRLKPVLHRMPNGSVLLAGGAAGPLLTTNASTELWNPLTNSWASGPTMPQAFALAAWAGLPNGSLAILGGGQGSAANFTPIIQVLRYTSGGGFSAGTVLSPALMNHTLTPLPDGTFLVAGGADATANAINAALNWNP